MYDVSQRHTFDTIRSWVEEVDRDCNSSVKILLAGKSDVEHPQVSSAEGATLARCLGVPFFEVSSKSDLNVREAFETLTKQILAQSSEGVREEGYKLRRTKKEPRKVKVCC